MNESDKTEGQKTVSLDYHFTEREIRILAKFFRNHQAQIPAGLVDFSMQI